MPTWLTKVLPTIAALSTKSQGLVALGTAIAAELASSDDVVRKAAEIDKDLANFAEQIDAALKPA